MPLPANFPSFIVIQYEKKNYLSKKKCSGQLHSSLKYIYYRKHTYPASLCRGKGEKGSVTYILINIVCGD